MAPRSNLPVAFAVVVVVQDAAYCTERGWNSCHVVLAEAEAEVAEEIVAAKDSIRSLIQAASIPAGVVDVVARSMPAVRSWALEIEPPALALYAVAAVIAMVLQKDLVRMDCLTVVRVVVVSVIETSMDSIVA